VSRVIRRYTAKSFHDGINATCDKCGASLLPGYVSVDHYRVLALIHPATGKNVVNPDGGATVCIKCAKKYRGVVVPNVPAGWTPPPKRERKQPPKRD